MCHRGLESKHRLEDYGASCHNISPVCESVPAVSFPWLLFLQFLCMDFFFRLILLVATFCQPFSLPPLATCLS